jgi:hypothetical protein
MVARHALLALIVLSGVGWLACVGDDPSVDGQQPDPNVPEGRENGKCGPGGVCFEGLECVRGVICLPNPDASASSDSGGGGEGGGETDGPSADVDAANPCPGDALHALHLPPAASLKIANYAGLLAATSHTIEFWAKFLDDTTSGLVFSKLQAGVEDKSLHYDFGDTCWWTLFKTPERFVSCNPSPYAQWHHYAFSNDGTTMRTYLDGKQGSTFVADTDLGQDGNGDLYFGKDPTRANLDGGPANPVGVDMVIAEIRISSVTRYTAQFAPPKRFTNDGATTGLWHLDETCGDTAFDSSSSPHHATVIGATRVADDRL